MLKAAINGMFVQTATDGTGRVVTMVPREAVIQLLEEMVGEDPGPQPTPQFVKDLRDMDRMEKGER